jgi:hypothetical protein
MKKEAKNDRNDYFGKDVCGYKKGYVKGKGASD